LLVEAVERVRGVVPAEVVVCSAGVVRVESVVNFVVITSLVVAVVCFEEVTLKVVAATGVGSGVVVGGIVNAKIFAATLGTKLIKSSNDFGVNISSGRTARRRRFGKSVSLPIPTTLTILPS